VKYERENTRIVQMKVINNQGYTKKNHASLK